MARIFPNIVCTEDTLGGSPRINGRRIAVGDVVSFVKSYGKLTEILNDYELTLPEVKEALEYCSSLQCKLDKPKLFCHNCSLRRQQVGPLDVSNLEEIPLDNGFIVKGDTSIFLGSMNDLLEDWKGQDMWTIATDLLIDLRNEL